MRSIWKGLREVQPHKSAKLDNFSLRGLLTSLALKWFLAYFIAQYPCVTFKWDTTLGWSDLYIVMRISQNKGKMVGFCTDFTNSKA